MDDFDSLIKEFMAIWRNATATAEDYYDDAEGSIGGLNKYIEKLNKEYEAYFERYGDIRDRLLEVGAEDIERRNELAGQYMEGARADYAGATGRAAADVTQQASSARDNLRREAAGYGIDPTSGAYAARIGDTYLDEAKAKASGMNAARMLEKNRATSAAGMGIQLFNPSNTIGVAQGIDQGGNNLLMAGASLQERIAQLRQSLASSYSSNILGPAAYTAGAGFGLSHGGGNNITYDFTPINHDLFNLGGASNDSFWYEQALKEAQQQAYSNGQAGGLY